MLVHLPRPVIQFVLGKCTGLQHLVPIACDSLVLLSLGILFISVLNVAPSNPLRSALLLVRLST